MRLQISRSKNAASFYVVKSVYENGRRTNKVLEKLGTYKQLKDKLGDKDPYEWAEEYVTNLNRLEREGKEPAIIKKYSPSKLIEKDLKRTFSGGYLFLQKIYYELGIDKICKDISNRHKFNWNLDSILSRLIYGRILFPSSKLSTYELSDKLIEPPDFELHQIYRALEVIAKEADYIQAALYKNSSSISKRNTGVLYYDCTNYFFEIEQSEGLKQYGPSKEHRPNPIVQMGLFMDGDGIPLSFSITEGNKNEQLTLRPLEEKILKDFGLSKFVVCTDAGLASNSNRIFNDKTGRAFVTTQSIKKLKAYLKKWALDPIGWHLAGSKRIYDIRELDEEKDKDKIFFKERWVNEGNLEQKLIVTYSIKYKNYLQNIRNGHIKRAMDTIEKGASIIKKHRQNDFKRLIKTTTCTIDGEIAKKVIHTLDTALIEKESAFDGFYAVCTNLDEDVSEIVKINKRRWKIEECFRIMKNEFKARPVYLKRDDRITAHFTTCFISLLVYRLLEKRLGYNKYTCNTIIDSLKGMDFKSIKGEGYEPLYTRTDFTDTLHDKFGFRTDYEIITLKNIKKIIRITKNR